MKETMKERILRAIQEALSGSCKIKIAIKRNRIDILEYLLKLAKAGWLELVDMDETTILAIQQSRDWDMDSNRRITLKINPEIFHAKSFASTFEFVLEGIAVLKQ